MKVKTFCSKCADWYRMEIRNTNGEILYRGTSKEVYNSNYKNKIIKEFVIDCLEGIKDDETITIYI